MEDLHKSTGLSSAMANGDAGGAAQKWPDSHMSYVARLGQHQVRRDKNRTLNNLHKAMCTKF